MCDGVLLPGCSTVAVPAATTPHGTVGERLRRRREEQKRSVGELAAETCITSRYLEAIEADDPKRLPGFFFYRNYVKQYARALGLDGAQMYQELAAAAPADEADLLSTLSATYAPHRAASARTGVRWWLRLTAAAGVLVVATAGLAAAVRSWDSPAPVAAVVAPPQR